MKLKTGPLALRRETYPKAKRDNQCRKCRRTILKGEHYNLVIGSRDGVWKALVTCLNCKPKNDEH